jgi:hypothetical protein
VAAVSLVAALNQHRPADLFPFEDSALATILCERPVREPHFAHYFEWLRSSAVRA